MIDWVLVFVDVEIIGWIVCFFVGVGLFLVGVDQIFDCVWCVDQWIVILWLVICGDFVDFGMDGQYCVVELIQFGFGF